MPRSLFDASDQHFHITDLLTFIGALCSSVVKHTAKSNLKVDPKSLSRIDFQDGVLLCKNGNTLF